MTSTQKVANDISYNMADDDEIYANAEKEWIPAGILLIPVFTRKEYLQAIGNELGETEYYKYLSKKHKLKESKLGVLTNHFKKIVEFIEEFKQIDLSSITVNRTHDLFKEAKKLGKGKITKQNVKIVLDQLTERNALKTTTDFRMYNTIKKYTKHAQELNLEDLGDPKNLPPFNKEDAAPFNKRSATLEVIDAVKEVKKPTPAPEVKKPTPAPEVKKPTPAPEVKKPTSAPEVKKPTPAPEVKKPTPAPETIKTNDIEEKAIITTNNVSISDESKLIGAYKKLDVDLKSHIIEMASLMQGEQDIALLKSLDERQTNAILKTIQLIAKQSPT